MCYHDFCWSMTLKIAYTWEGRLLQWSYSALNFAISFYTPVIWDRGLYQNIGLRFLGSERGYPVHKVPVSTSNWLSLFNKTDWTYLIWLWKLIFFLLWDAIRTHLLQIISQHFTWIVSKKYTYNDFSNSNIIRKKQFLLEYIL